MAVVRCAQVAAPACSHVIRAVGGGDYGKDCTAAGGDTTGLRSPNADFVVATRLEGLGAEGTKKHDGEDGCKMHSEFLGFLS